MRATASAFCYHQGAIFGGFVPLVLTWFASHYGLGFAIPMLIGTCVGAASFVIALLLGPETKGKILVPDLVVAEMNLRHMGDLRRGSSREGLPVNAQSPLPPA